MMGAMFNLQKVSRQGLCKTNSGELIQLLSLSVDDRDHIYKLDRDPFVTKETVHN